MEYSITKISWNEIIKDVISLTKKIKDKPDAIVTIGRGGNIPGTMLGYALNTKTVINFGVQSYTEDKTVTNIQVQQEPSNNFNSEFKGKNILVVDDLADKGTTLNYVKEYFKNKDINPIFCTLYIKEGTNFTPDLFTKKFKSGEWIEFPWDDLTSS